MNSVTELFKGVFEIAALVVSLAVLAVLVQSSGTPKVIQSASSGFEGILSTAMGRSGGAGGF